MYTPLKVTTDYSILKSLIKVKDLINFCIQKNIKSCAICDVNLFGVIEFYKACQSNHIKPIIGLEVFINNYSIYLYAENKEGYKNLLKINTIITERKISILELKNYCQHLLLIIPYKSIKIYEDLSFFSHIYLGYSNQSELQNALIKSNDVVYVNDIKAFSLEDTKYLKYLDFMNEMEEGNYLDNYFNYEHLTNYDLAKIDEVVNLLNVSLEDDKKYIPVYKENSKEFLQELCLKGLNKRLNNKVPANYLERLKYELNVINKMGFVDYFLIVYDYVLYAKKHDILVGPGRGSAAGSLVSFVIGITDIDPLKYNLLFERFLNYERVTMPDIDIDFDSTKREEVINYVKDKYGHDNVAGGITFTTLKTRLVLREVGNILQLDDKLLNKFLKVINKDEDLTHNLNNKDVKAYLSSYAEIKKMYQIALKLEGLKRNISTHAAGIVIASRPLDDIIPMYKNNDIYLTGVPMEYLEDLGLLKMDFLALKNLSTISSIIKHIPHFNINNIPLDDKEVYHLFCMGDTDGIFQFETPTFKSMLLKYEPHNFNELVASIALVRPGPSQELETYIKRKKGIAPITYYHEDLKSILEETYGVIVYQEQVISILVKMASFTYAEADNIRRAMAKKKMDIILKQKEEFLKRSTKNGYPEDLANNIYEHIIKFADYGFNKAHSVAYAIISYQMAYLKVHYKALFTFTLLDSTLGSSEKVKKYLVSLKQSNLLIEPVHINKSTNEFILDGHNVYLPFKLIKNLNKEVINNIIEERNKNGLYSDIFAFFKRTCKFMTKNDYLKVINADVFHDFEFNMKTLISNLDEFINYGNLSLELGDYALIPHIEKISNYKEDTLRLNELNSYGFFISNHPASKEIGPNVLKIVNMTKNAFKNVYLYVMIENVKRIKTKKNEDMAFLRASDETGEADFTVFPQNIRLIQDIKPNDMVKIWGTVSKRFDKYHIIVNNLKKD